jgi:hypothetical protein
MRLLKNNFGLTGRFSTYDDGYDNLLGLGKKGKEKRQARHDRKDQRKDSRQEKRDHANERRRLKNDMRQAKIDEKKATTAAMTTQLQQPATPTPAQSSDNTVMVLGVVGVVVVLGVIGFVIKGRQSPQNTQPILQAA